MQETDRIEGTEPSAVQASWFGGLLLVADQARSPRRRRRQMAQVFDELDLPSGERELADRAAQTGVGIQQSLERLLAQVASLTSRPADPQAMLALLQSANASFSDVASQLAQMNDVLRTRIADLEARPTPTR